MHQVLRRLTALVVGLFGCLCQGHVTLAQVPSGVSFSLVMVTFVNNANPPAFATTSQTILGTGYTQDSCSKAMATAFGRGPGGGDLNRPVDMLRVYFFCVQNPAQ
jgi:hypothetical protein